MSRIKKVFDSVKKKSELALIPFITMGDPSINDTVELVLEMEKSGADIIEIGVPYNDPLADGPVIQDSYYRALQNGCNLKGVFSGIELIRKESEIPLVMMVYYNIIFCYGVKLFFENIKKVGVDGIIIPDLPLEEISEVKEYSDEYNIDLISLVAPTSKERIGKIVADSSGFIYCVSVNGTTGERSNVSTNIDEYLSLVKRSTDLPCCVGFGISSKEDVDRLRGKCDGVIVGSAIVKRINKGKDDIANFIKSLEVK